MIDPYLIWTPILVLPVVGLLRFLGCAVVAGLGSNYSAAAPLAITGPGSPPEGAENQTYPGATFQATGGTPPYTWSWAPPTPPGLDLQPKSGVSTSIVGTPTTGFVPPVPPVTITVTDSSHPPQHAPLTVNLNVLGIATNSLPPGQLDVLYTFVLTSLGGTGVIAWSSSGQPTGLAIPPASNTIIGTPTESGSFTVKVVATDANNVSTRAQLQLDIAEPFLTIFSTGVDAGGQLVASSAANPATDQHYDLHPFNLTNPKQSAFIVDPATLPGPWVGQGGTKSQWIAPQVDGGVNDAVGDYYYVTTFDLTGFDPTTASITGISWSDNAAFYTLNGGAEQPLSGSPNAFGFTIPAGPAFNAGPNNTLVVRVNNASGPGPNPTGLQLQMTGTAVPKP
jgi:hypothetical protein